MKLFPVGLNAKETLDQATRNHNEFKKAIKSVIETMFSFHQHNYVHSDIRWPNFTYNPRSGNYLMFDFENICLLCTQVNCKKLDHRHSEFKNIRTCQNPFEDIKHILLLFSRIKQKEKEEEVILCQEFDEQYDEYVRFAYRLEQETLTRQLTNESKDLFWELHTLLFGSKLLNFLFCF